MQSNLFFKAALVSELGQAAEGPVQITYELSMVGEMTHCLDA